MPLTIFLIDKAADVCGSSAKLAGRLGISRQLVTDWRKGKSLPTEVQTAKMAEIAGLRIDDALLARAEDALAKTEEGRQLLDVMKRGFLRGAAAIFAIFATVLTVPPDANAKSMCQPAIDTLYIVSRKLRTWVFNVRMALKRHRGPRFVVLSPA